MSKNAIYKVAECASYNILYLFIFLLSGFFYCGALGDTTGMAYSQNDSISSQSFDSDKGVNVSIQQDSMLGLIGQIRSFFMIDENQAIAGELDGGSRVWRANGTYGFSLNENNRIKLTAEYLREYLDFSFYTGDTRQWVGQGAIGAAYQYGLDTGRLKNFTVNTHYSSAQSKDLSTQTIIYADGSTLTDYRRIAGAKDLNGNMDVDLQLWKDSTLTLGPDYDRVRYDTQYDIQNGQNAQGFGGHARLDQSLRHHLSFELDSTLSQVYNIYGAGLNWVWYSNRKTTLSTGINSSYTQDRTAERNFWVNALTVGIVWDAPQTELISTEDDVKNANALLAESTSSNILTTWVQTPAVRMPDVLAISDERITSAKAAFVPISGVCPLGTDVQYNNIKGQYSASGGWYQSYPHGLAPAAFLINFDSANIMTSPSGQAACFYELIGPPPNVSPIGTLVLINDTYQHAQGVGSGWNTGYSPFWPEAPYPSLFCNIAASNSCVFNTVSSN